MRASYFFRVLFVLLFVGISTTVSFGQTTIFNLAGGGAFPSGWSGVNNITTNAIDRTSYYLVDAGSPSDIITSATYDLCSYTSASLTLDVATFGSGGNNPAKIEISYDGGSSYPDVFTTNTPTSSSYIAGGTFALTQFTALVVIRISNNGTSGKGVRLQNIILTASGSGSCGGSNDTDSEVQTSATLTEPNTVSSLNDSNTEWVDVFDFTFEDVGATGDGLATILDAFEITQGSANDVADWTNAIAAARINGPDLTNEMGTVGATGITFAGADFISIANGSNETYTLSIYLNTDLSNISDNDNLEFKLDYTDITADASGSDFGAGAPESGDTKCAIDIDATELVFTTVPGSANNGDDFTVVVTAVDENGNVDTDETSSVTLALATGAGTLSSVTGLTQNLSTGTYTWTDVQHNIDETITIEAQSGTLTNVTSGNIVISTPSCGTGLIITEVADPGDNANGRFYEFLNIGPGTIDFSSETWYFCVQVNGGSWTDVQLSGSVASGGKFIFATSSTNYNTAYGLTADQVHGTFNGNGDDAFYLYKNGDHTTGTLVDIYGEINQDGTGRPWEYTDSRAVRASTILNGNTTWTASEWTISAANVADMTPTTHTSDCPVACSGPSSQASFTSFTSVNSTDFIVNFASGTGGNGHIVIVRESAAVATTPSSGVTYTANSIFGSGSAVGSGYVVYDGTGTSVNVTGLTANTTYHVAVFEYVTGGATDPCYETSLSGNIGSQLTDCAATPDDVTGNSYTVDNAEATISWTNPTNCFDEVMVIVDDGTVGTTPTGNGSAYTANSVYGSGTNTQGLEYVVYKGTGTSINVTGLTNGEDYCYKIWTRYGSTWSSGVTQCNVIPVVPIPEDDCGGSEAALTYTYSGGSSISDVNVSVFIEHTYRGDLHIELESPSGTIVILHDGEGTGADNLEATFDDEAGGFISSTSHTLDYAVDETVKPSSGGGDLLSDFDGESPNGTWIIHVCDGLAGDIGYLNNFTLDITNNCIPTHSITNFAPTEGPEFTYVTITGTGFTGSSTVSFGGVAASNVTFVNATTLLAEVPTGAATGNIVITESTCDLTASGTFTVFEEIGTCFSSNLTGDTPNDLIISEVYDAVSGSLAYVEVYNGTGSSINLSGYTIERYTTASGGSPSYYYTFPSTGVGSTIADGEALVGSISSGFDPSIMDFQFGWSGGGTPAGINDDDRLDLYNGATHIDRWYDDAVSNAGYTYIRTNITNTPTYPTTHTPADWNNSDPESTADLGLVGSAVTPPTVTAQPTDETSCSITMSLTASPSNAGALTYQWLYNDGSSSSWSNVTSGAPFASATVSGETSNSLSISGTSMEDFENYQFYCQVLEDGSCGTVTEAVQFYPTSNTYFRTKSSGNWTDAANWEMATSSGGPWSDACTYPEYDNSDYVHILSGHTVTVTADITLDEITVESGGILDLEMNSQVTLNDATGIELSIEGTLIDNNVGIDQIVWNGSSTWSLGTSGTMIKTNTSNVDAYENNFDGGIANIPATSNWIYRYTSNSVSLPTNYVGMYYGNLTIESNNGFYDMTLVTEKFTGSSGFGTVKGDFNVGGSGSGTVKVYHVNTSATAMPIGGDLIIQTGSTLINDDASTIGTGFDVEGDVTIDGTLTINNTGKLQLTGPSTQTTSGSGTNSIANLEINNTSAGGISMTSSTIDLNVTSTLTLTDGVITTNNNKVNVSSTAHDAISGYSSASFINGNLRRGFASNTDTYEFPLGHSGTATSNYHPADIINANLSGVSYIDSYVSAITESGSNVDGNISTSQNGTPLTDIDASAQWSLVPNAAPSGGTYGVNLYVINTNLSASDDGKFCPVKRNDGSTTYADWDTFEGSTTIPGASSAGRIYNSGNGYAQRTGYSSFSLHAIGKAAVILPVELILFNATLNGNDVNLDWTTMSEINNDYFEIQRSLNSTSIFSAIGKSLGAGNSDSRLDYSFVDKDVPSGVLYYRLKQVDFDGKYSFSDIKAVKVEKGITTPIHVVNYPAEVIVFNTEEEVSVELYNSFGQIIEAKQSSGTISFSKNEYATGVYLLRIISGSEVRTEKIKF